MNQNSIIDQLRYDPVSGALNYRDVRYLLIRPETIVGFQKTIEKHSRTGAQEALFQGAISICRPKITKKGRTFQTAKPSVL